MSKEQKIPQEKKKKDQKSKEYLEYQRYIRSREFKEIRKLVLERDNYECQICKADGNKRRLTVHHKTYDHLFNEKEHLDDLITLCNVCHSAIHKSISNKELFKNKKKKD